MGLIQRLASGVAGLVVALLMWPSTAAAAPADGGLGLDIKADRSTYALGDPVKLTFTITNSTGAACGLTTVADGTVQVLSVRRNGEELSPVPGRSFYLDGINSAIASGMVTTPPGSTVNAAVVGVRVRDGSDAGSVVLRSVSATSGGGGLDALWPIGATGQYEVTASYAVPAVDGAVAPCTGVTGAQTVRFAVGEVDESGLTWLWRLGAAVMLAAGTLVLVILFRRRRHAAAASVLLIVGLVTAIASPGEPAHADYEVDPNAGLPVSGVDFPAAVDACLAAFATPGGDPAGILARLKDPKTPEVRIIPTTGGSNAFETPDSPAGKGSSTVTWNPTSTEAYSDGVARDPCSALYHELTHADDISKDAVPQGECGDTGIKTAEVKATFSENKYRAGRNLPQRTEYDGKTLPRSLDDCKKKPTKKKPPARGPVRLCEGAGANQCASTNGDPHLVTFDRAYYDFQAVGEFVVVRSTSGDPLEVQARQAPMGDSRTVSVNSAVGVRMGVHRLSLAIVGGATQVRVDGESVTVTRGERSLPGGGTLERRESDLGAIDGYNVRWPDGSEAAVDQIGPYGYRLLIKLAPARAGKVQGLLGDFDGDPVNDIAAPSGVALAQPVPFDKLYPSYADSWRVSQETSLFSYADGENTQTFTDRTFPARQMTLADLDAGGRARAEQVCRWAGITDPWLFNECVFDVAASGRSEFAQSTASTQLIAAPVAPPIAAKPVASGTLAPGQRLTFTGHAGDAIFIDITAPTMPDRCSPIRLLDPTRRPIGSGCVINGTGYIDRTDLIADGEYAVEVDGDVVRGRATIRIYAGHDSAGTVEPNGPPTSVTIEQPGSVGRYRFTGTAGQRVFVEVLDSTLPDQCSPLMLIDQSGSVLNAGCVINGFGFIDGTLLPDAGTYTVVVDAESRTIGTVRLRLFAAKDRTASISLSGRPILATIDQPGVVTRYEFTATAGERITLDATGATLPDQCSPIELRDRAGGLLDSACIINGTGRIEAVLPAAGTYTIVVDPSGEATGAVSLSLRA